jgi:uncharacterized heparinase superfamily protein
MDNGSQHARAVTQCRAGGRIVAAREHVGLAVLAMRRASRGTLARMRRSRLLMWQYSSPAAEELLLTPPDLRAHDASFVDEIIAGGFGLAGTVAALNGRSPFAVTPPSPAWARELHGFGWLRHLEAAGSGEARAIAQNLVKEWVRRSGRGGLPDEAWAAEVVGRRIVSWLSHSSLLLDGTEPKRYAAVMRCLGAQITYLATAWRDAPDGYPRLVSLIGLVNAALCIAGHDRQLAQAQSLLVAELRRQCAADGGHMSRNAWTLVELLLDLLPLRRCFSARGKAPEAALLACIGQMTAMLRHMRLGDGTLARFNGVGAAERDALATVLGYDDGSTSKPASMRSGYVRLQRGSTVVLADAGPAPPLPLAGAACAGCLSFEVSCGSELLIANGGVPRQGQASRRNIARGTASHNTLCLGERSSARLVRDARLEREVGSAPLRHPDNVACTVREADGAAEFEASHDGYVESLGLVHTRSMTLADHGRLLAGCDRLAPAKGVIRFTWDVPYALHFHLHPDVDARIGSSPEIADLWLDSGELWQLTAAAGAVLSIEDGIFFAGSGEARPAFQVVLRATCYGAAEACWTLRHIGRDEPVYTAALKRRGAGLVDRLAETRVGPETTEGVLSAS